jgi:hypothetical protein
MKPPAAPNDPRQALDAFAVHAALLRAERAEPSLRENPRWILIRMDAAEAFVVEFEKAR